MKIVHIVPGSGGTFYCQNCMRDNDLIVSLSALGHDVLMIPMYLPLHTDVDHRISYSPVFYGAINIYLKERIPIYRRAPAWIERIFDSPALLRMAAKKSGSTNPAGLGEMTISVLRGEKGRQASELEHLIRFLREEVRPDIVHLSNALLLGLAYRLKHEVGARVVCSLQDENEWIELMTPELQEKAWTAMAERTVDVDICVAPSDYYAERSKGRLGIPAQKIAVVHDGINFTGYERSQLPLDPPVLGYLCRMSEYFGLGIVIDAYMRLKESSSCNDLKLYLMGGYSRSDLEFINAQLRRLKKAGMRDGVTVFEDFGRDARIDFLKSLTLLSVPVPGGEAFGAYQVEALAAGVPVVQPNVGFFPEFVKATGGGIIYDPNDGEHLAGAIASLLGDRERIAEMSEEGRQRVLKKFSIETMAEHVLELYTRLLEQGESGIPAVQTP